MKKLLVLMGIGAVAVVAGLVIKDQYDQMKELEDELNANPIYKAKHSIETLNQEKKRLPSLAISSNLVNLFKKK